MVCREEEEGKVNHLEGSRDSNRFSSKSREPMALASIVLFNGHCEFLALN